METFNNISQCFSAASQRCVNAYNYCTTGVWKDQRTLWWVYLIKIVNLSVRSFLNKNLQEKACALTYRTILALVPVVAMLFAICRGFGFQDLLETELLEFFSSQQEMLRYVLSSVDAYLARASSGLFVGIGLVLMLYTLVSLLSSVEDAFNDIWGIREPRTFYRRLIDYAALFLILPILVIATSGLQILALGTVKQFFDIESQPISFIIDFLSSAIMWVVFIGVFVIIPNTKVHLKNAVVSGIICGSAFQLVQYLFVTGQIYVTNYNAIYGSFAFLPLFLIFVQLSWLICLSGAVTTYSSQNVYHFNYVDDIDNISPSYLHEITVIIFAAIASRFSRNMQAFTQIELTKELGIPVKMVQNAINRLIDTKLVLESAPRDEETRYSPSGSLEKMTLNKVSEILRNTGESDFVPEISENFATEIEQIRKLRAQHLSNGDILIKDLLTESNRK